MTETVDPRAGSLPVGRDLVDIDELVAAYHEKAPAEPVSFGTSGHRGTSLDGSFTAAHVAAISEAVCRYRAEQGITGPLFLGRDTHALSSPAFDTIVAVLSANGVDIVVDAAGGATPTPVISHAILTHNRGGGPRADGIVVTPSHNPPGDGGFKYNPPHGGPAGSDVTGWIERAANAILKTPPQRGSAEPGPAEPGAGVTRGGPAEPGPAEPRTTPRDYVASYVDDLRSVIDVDAIARAGVRIGVDPLGGAALAYWQAIRDRLGLDITIVNEELDPTFRFVPLDWDGVIRMDCSSPYAMARLRDLAADFDVAVANDPDADRHGIVTPTAGLLNPNHYLAVCVDYLFGGGRAWGPRVGVGKTLVSSSIIDRVTASHGRELVEVPVGFKWFVDGLIDGTLGFGGEESAGASFLRRDGSVWSTDKDGLIPCLLAAEIKATTGADPGERYAALTERFGAAAYRRTDVAATAEQRAILGRLTGDQVPAQELAGEPIRAKLTVAPGNGAPIGGLKVVADNGWFAARPSGTEDIYKIYAESLDGPERLDRIVDQAQQIVGAALGA